MELEFSTILEGYHAMSNLGLFKKFKDILVQENVLP